MKELKITIDQLKNYLGTDLKGVHYREGIRLERSLTNTNIIAFVDNETDAKLLFYRLSDLDKEIEHNGERFVPELQMMEIWSRYHKDSIKSMHQLQVHETELYRVYHDLKKLFEWHFWPFGDEYFEQGLVIDKMKHNV